MRLAVTPGEPAGIGPDLLLQIAATGPDQELVAIADPEMLAERARILQCPVKLANFDPAAEPGSISKGTLKVLPVKLRANCVAGELNKDNAIYVLDTLNIALEGCSNGKFDALVTGPVHKGIINEAGIPFSGHTEFLAQQTSTSQVVMMLATDELRVALVTTHLPLREVADAIDRELLEHVIRITDSALRRDFGISEPRIIVAGLNPHAGEDGHLGTEELDIIIPCLEALRKQGYQLSGPLPADTLFTEQHLSEGDAVLAMYHDQGLPVLKAKGFGKAVNVTLGLPIIRTSVDHGTALTLAGKGVADSGSMKAALEFAADLVRRSKR